MTATQPTMERQKMDVDIVCVGFGPATGGFLTTLNRELVNPDGTPKVAKAPRPAIAARRLWRWPPKSASANSNKLRTKIPGRLQ